MGKKATKAKQVYDDSNAKKAAGLAVWVRNGFSLSPKPFLFGVGCTYKFVHIDDDKWVAILDQDGTVAAHFRRDDVTMISGPVYLFRDKEW